MNSFMSSIKSAVGGAGDGTKSTLDQSSNTDLVSSAKLVAEAAQCAATNQTDKIDKPKVAGATADLLDSVKQYGKFDESQGVGQYIKQADDYLHQYEKSGGVDGTDATPSLQAPEATHDGKKEFGGGYEASASLEEQNHETSVSLHEKKDETPAPLNEKSGKEEYASGFGTEDAFKAAGSFFK
ncbi:hypothetical protein E3N88_03788 [Mikania micrantha]|uniref:Uncharacterized protein n=1 Tax=Mikania micrantha TaxID=192012 RepID=A0A5N6PVB9_9ASTR|nr:hypothetical protein E3N88_03788 [Mikania micrantha]